MFELYAMQRDYAAAYLEAIFNVTAEERATALDRFGDAETPDILAIEGNEATINISGPLSPNGPSPIARFFGFGGTGYRDIVTAAGAVLQNPAIDTVRLRMDTPGGSVSGMESAAQAIAGLKAAGRRVIAENHGMIASAGYRLAVEADEIVALADNAMTGSIGVIIAGIDPSKAMERAGFRRVRIVSSNAPDKAADPTTDHGLAVLQEQVDALERVFISQVAEGRGVTPEAVVSDFGRGGMLIANDPDKDKPDAVGVGMIDRVAGVPVAPTAAAGAVEANNDGDVVEGGGDPAPVSQAAEGGGQHEGAIMDLATLKAEHPALFQAAADEGAKRERARASAHLKLGQTSGDLGFAVQCVEDGTEMDASVQAHYMSAHMQKVEQTARASESEGEIETDASEEADDLDAAAAAQLAEKWGVESNG